MTFLMAILFLHVLAALGFAISLSMEWLVSIQLKRATVAAEVRQLMGITRRLPAVGAPSAILVLATGLLMAAVQGLWSQWWIVFSLVAMGLLIALGAGMTGPGTMTLRRAAASTLGESSPAQELEGMPLGSRKLALALRLKTMLLVCVVFLMTAHPELPGCAASLGLCLLTGLLWSVGGAGRPGYRALDRR